MKKLKSSLKNMAIVLTLIAIVAGGVLATVNAITKPQIDKINEENLANGIKAVMNNDNIKVSEEQTKDEYSFYTVQDAQGQPLGTAVTSTVNGFGGPLKVLVGFDNDGAILGYTVLESAETPGLGAKAQLWFQKGQKGDIIGRKPGERKLQVTKDTNDPEDVDAITASTITSRAFLSAIQNAYDVVIKGQDAQSGATRQSGAKQESKQAEACEAAADSTANDSINQ